MDEEDRARLHDEDLYVRLGIGHDASFEEIRQAYRALLREYPPERYPEEFKQIRQAYEILSDPSSRKDFDSRPDPIIAIPLERGMDALREDSYEVAEQAFKLVLLHKPEMAYVRNLLGLAFLYQQKNLKALEQFERIVLRPDASAAWFGNIGQTFLRLERFAEAKTAFAQAIERASDNPVNYVVGLADAFCGMKDFTAAAAALEQWIHADGVVDFQDLDYFVRLIEVHIQADHADAVRQALRQVRHIAGDDEQAGRLALKVGLLACNLVRAERFDYAHALSALSRELQPDDGDYDALGQVATLLHHNRLDSATGLLTTHPSFGVNGWLYGLGQWITSFVAYQSVFGSMKPTSAPPLYTINGIGTMLYGSREPDLKTNSHIATLYFTVLFIPIAPLACYRVIPSSGSSWRFLGKVPWSRREWWHLWILVGLLWYALASDAFATSGSSSYTPPAPTSPAASTSQVGNAGDYLPPPVVATEPSDAERALLMNRQAALEVDLARLRTMRSELEVLKRRISGFETGFGGQSTDDPGYELTLNRHNSLVDDINYLRERLQSESTVLDRDIDAYNLRIKQ